MTSSPSSPPLGPRPGPLPVILGGAGTSLWCHPVPQPRHILTTATSGRRGPPRGPLPTPFWGRGPRCDALPLPSTFWDHLLAPSPSFWGDGDPTVSPSPPHEGARNPPVASPRAGTSSCPLPTPGGGDRDHGVTSPRPPGVMGTPLGPPKYHLGGGTGPLPTLISPGARWVQPPPPISGPPLWGAAEAGLGLAPLILWDKNARKRVCSCNRSARCTEFV